MFVRLCSWCWTLEELLILSSDYIWRFEGFEVVTFRSRRSHRAGHVSVLVYSIILFNLTSLGLHFNTLKTWSSHRILLYFVTFLVSRRNRLISFLYIVCLKRDMNEVRFSTDHKSSFTNFTQNYLYTFVPFLYVTLNYTLHLLDARYCLIQEMSITVPLFSCSLICKFTFFYQIHVFVSFHFLQH